MQVNDKATKQATGIRQASLIEAALRLAAQRSPADITTTDLAQAVGITQGAVFRHFASKEDLWLGALDWVSQTLMARLRAAAECAVAMDALRAVFMAHVDFVTQQPGVPRVLFQELQHAQETALKSRVRDLMQQYRQLVNQLLRQALTEHAVDPGVDLQAATVLFIGSVQGLVMQSLISGDPTTMVQHAAPVFDIYRRGLCRVAPATT